MAKNERIPVSLAAVMIELGREAGLPYPDAVEGPVVYMTREEIAAMPVPDVEALQREPDIAAVLEAAALMIQKT